MIFISNFEQNYEKHAFLCIELKKMNGTFQNTHPSKIRRNYINERKYGILKFTVAYDIIKLS